ncbi:hypothetical protein MSG28_008599 [Choristoneura fumiferana]|uniref:Uncharacterized protein n=1 Tax=Choristoneura fumiferana TaxID=7141 RepID=A0ACC0J7E5_CHOFU|nr:hypothetical protein MSG28_008599 [Choristoneura fumiferana]
MGDAEAETDRRCRIIQGLERATVLKIQKVLHDHNVLVHEFQIALENMPDENCKVVIHADRVPSGQHARRYNAPAVAEIAAVVAGADLTAPRDIVLRKHNDSLARIADTHRFYDALQYPILFWKGQEGYHFSIPQTNPTGRPNPNKKMSCMDFYAFHLMVREHDFNLPLRCRVLLSQFLVEMYVKMESKRLRFIALNQSKLRAENYIHLQDAIANDSNVNSNDLGQMVILPSSVVNSPRYLHAYTQDAFSYVQKYGRPDLFLTFTCNPAWTEIKEELMDGQRQTDRHDIIARVFKIKVEKLVAFLTKGHVFGESQCFMYSIEWQKRGLPHVHLLLWLKEKLRPNQIDAVISAELPDPNVDKPLYDTVTKSMIHGPCGVLNPASPCMKDRKCSKKYPRALLKETQTNDNGYPLYRRRGPEEGGRTVTITVRGTAQEVVVDNSWVVPYSPLLSKMFNAHINMEFCNSVQTIKYICKYINKGSDQAIFSVQQQGNPNIAPRDEVQIFRAGRYVSSNV